MGTRARAAAGAAPHYRVQLHVKDLSGGDVGGVNDGLGPVLPHSAYEAGPLRGQPHKTALPAVEPRVHTVLKVAGRRDDRLLLFPRKHPAAAALPQGNETCQQQVKSNSPFVLGSVLMQRHR